MSDRDAFREARDAGLAARQAKRLEAATYTAAEVKVLTETASKVAYALGRKDAGEEIAEELEALNSQASTLACAMIARDVASRGPGATSDATSGVPRHSEVSEAARSPQEPCGHPTCLCADMHSHPEGKTR